MEEQSAVCMRLVEISRGLVCPGQTWDELCCFIPFLFFFLLHFSSASLSELRAALWIHFPVLERARVHSSSSQGPAQAARGSLKDHRRWEMKWGGTEGPCTAWLL